MSKGPEILYCHCAGGETADARVRREVLDGLCRSGRAFRAVPDLCGLAARRDPLLEVLAASPDARIAACFPRAVRGLFEAAGWPLKDNAGIANMRTDAPREILHLLTDGAGKARGPGDCPSGPLNVVLYEGPGSRPLEAPRRVEVVTGLLQSGVSVTCTAGAGRLPSSSAPLLVLGRFAAGELPVGDEPAATCVYYRDVTGLDGSAIASAVASVRADAGAEPPGDWTPWFPVIDSARCTNCKQCLSFCLFGVYALDEAGRVEVRNPANCKTNCPACARVCPEVAIIFPKHASAPINGGEVSDADVARGGVKVDLAAALGGDVYATLRGRAAAERERCECLERIGEQLEIPPEVLESLRRK